MRRITFPVVATSAILSATALMAGVANASPLGAATNANVQRTGDSVQQVGWDGGYRYHHRPFFHDRFFFHHRHHPFFFHRGFHRFHRW